METDCLDSQGPAAKGNCGYSTYPTSSCYAFCAQVPGTNKCSTTRLQASLSWSPKMPCPKSAQTSVTSEGKSNVCGHVTGVVLLSGDFSRCPASTSCPYDSASMYCTPTDEEPIVDDQNLKQELNEKGIKLHKICPTAPNHSSGTPSFFADLRVPDDNAACQVACACNEKKGFGPPDCFPKGEPLGLFQRVRSCYGGRPPKRRFQPLPCLHVMPIRLGEHVLHPNRRRADRG